MWTCRVPLYTCFAFHNKHTVHHFHNNIPQQPIMLLLKGVPACECRNIIIFPIVCCLISEPFILYDPRARAGTTEVVRTTISSLHTKQTKMFFQWCCVWCSVIPLFCVTKVPRFPGFDPRAVNIKYVGHVCFWILRFHRYSKLTVIWYKQEVELLTWEKISHNEPKNITLWTLKYHTMNQKNITLWTKKNSTNYLMSNLKKSMQRHRILT